VVSMGLALCLTSLSPSTATPAQYVDSFLQPTPSQLSFPPLWGRWAIAGWMVLGAGAVTGLLPARERGWARATLCIGTAFCWTTYLCWAYLPTHLLLGVLLFASLAAQALFVGFIDWPSARVAQILPFLYAASLGLYAALLLSISASFGSVSGILGKESARSWRVVALGLGSAMNLLIALFLRFHQSLSSSTYARRTHTLTRRGIPVGWEWAPVASNLSVALSFATGVWLSLVYLNGSHLSVVALSSMLLLLQQDHLFLRSLLDTSRYLPPVATASAALLISALWDIARGLGESTWLVWIKDVVLVGSSVLLLWPFLLFLRNHKGRVPFGASVWAVAPLGLAALVLAGPWAARFLAAGALLGAATLAILSLLAQNASLRRI